MIHELVIFLSGVIIGYVVRDVIDDIFLVHCRKEFIKDFLTPNESNDNSLTEDEGELIFNKAIRAKKEPVPEYIYVRNENYM